MRLTRGLFALLALVAAAAQAQPLPPADEYHVRTFTTEDGLQGNDAGHLAQSGDGFLYVGNAKGLTRFDGRSFRRLPLPEFSTTSISQLVTDLGGRLWVRSTEGEVGYVENGRLVVLPYPEGLSRFGPISATSDGSLWIGSTSGLFRYRDRSEPHIERYTTRDGLPSNHVSRVNDAGDGRVYVYTNGGHAWVRPAPWTDQRMGFAPFRPSAPSRFLHPLSQRADLAQILGVVRYDGVPFVSGDRADPVPLSAARWLEGHPVQLPGQLGRRLEVPGLPSAEVGWVLRSTEGDLWLSARDPLSRRDRVFVVRNGRASAVRLDGAPPFREVNRLLEDHEGSLWIGTELGLIQLVPRRVLALDEHHGLAETLTLPVLQDRRGDVWVGTWGGGLHRFSDGALAERIVEADGVTATHVRSLYEAPNGTLWIGTRDGALVRRDGRLRHVMRGTRREFRAFAERPDGAIWAAHQGGLTRISPGGRIENVPDAPIELRALLVDRRGLVWAGGDEGLIRLVGDRPIPAGTSAGLDAERVASLTEWDDGSLWVGTYMNGLVRIRNGRTARITRDAGLPSTGVWTMLPDDRGGVWMSSDDGLWRVSYARLAAAADAIERGERPAPLAPIVFTAAEGMPSRECNRASPAAWRLRDGRLLFNNFRGLVLVDLDRALASPPPPRTVLRSVEADGQSVASMGGPVRLSEGVEHVTFGLTALSFIAPSQHRFRYRLDGYDTDWTASTTTPQAAYTGLPPGRYTFRAQAASGTSGWGPESRPYTVVVPPAPWQTWWLRSLVAVLVVGALALLYRYRVRQLLEVERLRLRIAADLHDDIGSSLSSIALLGEMLDAQSALDGTGRRQVSRIRAAAQETTTALRDVIWLVEPGHSTPRHLVEKMKTTAADMLADVPYRFDLSLSNPDRSLSMGLMRNAYLVFKEAVHNVAKHAHPSRVRIEVSDAGGMLTVQVEDDGQGFHQEAPSSGRGLRSMHDRARQLDGHLAIESRPDGGTHLRFSVPLA